MKSPIDALPLPQVCYHFPTQDYWIPDSAGKWIRINETSVKRYLKSQGFSESKDADLTQVDETLLKIQQTQNVAYAAKLAGYDAGFYEINGTKILVTESPKSIVPKAGDWPLLETILGGMLNVESFDQRPYFFSWMKRSMESLIARKWTQSQVLAFAGPRNSAKSLLQSLITEMFGGRSAKPFLHMSGKTDFNGDLFLGEHLVVEDECESIDFKARRHFGASIKQVAVNKTHLCHGKHREGLSLTPWWRMTISLNDDPERLLVLPSITDDIEDKIMLFKVAQQSMPMPTETADAKEAFWNAMVAELPAFLDFLLKYEIPEALSCQRFGVKHFHHPEILQALEETSPENRLLSLVDKELFSDELFGGERAVPRELTALDLENLLTMASSDVAREAKLLLTYQNSCGSYLSRLAKSHPHRVTKRKLEGQTQWTLLPSLKMK